MYELGREHVVLNHTKPSQEITGRIHSHVTHLSRGGSDMGITTPFLET